VVLVVAGDEEVPGFVVGAKTLWINSRGVAVSSRVSTVVIYMRVPLCFNKYWSNDSSRATHYFAS